MDTRVIYRGDNLEQLAKLPNACVDPIYIDPPLNSNRNHEVFWGETKETRSFADRHESTQAYIEFMRPRCVELVRVLKRTDSFSYHSDSQRYGANHDTIFFYANGRRWTWNPIYMEYSAEYVEQNYRYKDADGRVFRVSDMTAHKPGGDVPEGKAVQGPILGLRRGRPGESQPRRRAPSTPPDRIGEGRARR